MQIIKDKQIIDDNWVFIADDDKLTAENIVVSLAQFRENKTAIFEQAKAVGIRLNPADSVAELAEDLARICLIELNFTDFADGRLFSQAWLLRERYGYTGEIRAVGKYLTDQAYYLTRVGVNSFAETPEPLTTTLTKLNDFSVHYQSSVN